MHTCLVCGADCSCDDTHTEANDTYPDCNHHLTEGCRDSVRAGRGHDDEPFVAEAAS